MSRIHAFWLNQSDNYYRAMHVVLARYSIVGRPSVCLSVCLSVTLMYRGRMCWVSSKLITRVRAFDPRSHNIGNLVQGEHPQNSGRIGVGSFFSTENVQCLWKVKRGKTGPRLLLMTNRKSRTLFRLVPKSTTLDDHEGNYALCFKTHACFGDHHENLNEDRPTLSTTKM